MSFLAFPQLVERVAELAHRFKLKSAFGPSATVLMARALQSQGYRARTHERLAHIILSDAVSDGVDLDLSKCVQVLEVSSQVVDLDGNCGWSKILENLAAHAATQERAQFPRPQSSARDTLCVVAYFGNAPQADRHALLDRAKPTLAKLKKALAVRNPRLSHVVETPRFPPLEAVQELCPCVDLDALDGALELAFASRNDALPVAAVVHEVEQAMGPSRTLVREVAYQSDWLCVRAHRVVVEYGQPLRRVCVDPSGAWEGVSPHEAIQDPDFDPSRVHFGAVSPITIPLCKPNTSADLAPLRAQLSHAALLRTTAPGASGRRSPRI